MISIKSSQEIEFMRRSGAILAKVKRVLREKIKPGVSTEQLDKLASQMITKLGGQPSFLGYQGYPKTICASVNEQMIHGLPTSRSLVRGDLLKIDVGVKYRGYHTDSAFSVEVGQSSPAAQKLIAVAQAAFWRGVDAIKPGARVGDVEHAIGSYVRGQGLTVPTDYSGHGIGTQLHEDPSIFNDGLAGRGPLLRDGMTICIEPMILQSSSDVKVLDDGWTVVASDGKLTAHYEETILIENGQAVILTQEGGDGDG
ncbi:type I methionyl aminopeptidase [Mycoplasma sp. ATU-Cv-508]|uniref:type I methionyl aminopeptidase n=1 Tax=Mycoplasma sp. ATU-Cv-508 TaxID=2048001 RepID=UPI00191BAA1F